jgi:hypothetical protein
MGLATKRSMLRRVDRRAGQTAPVSLECRAGFAMIASASSISFEFPSTLLISSSFRARSATPLRADSPAAQDDSRQRALTGQSVPPALA